MGLKCPKCQFNNPDTQEFCGECGTQLKAVYAETKTLLTPVKDSAIGEIISEKYKLLEELGSGGMGVVYKAEQIKPVKRNVALKIIKLGMDTKQVIARFENERQALAVMDHPNIAKVLDGGATETGRPYFVMEIVRGLPITEYCDKHKLAARERLKLFIHVCQAIQHAHQKGVIHRDLKPSNILVVVQEDKPIPKIIDFGIAKAIEHRLTERTLFTEQGQLIGTPEYMSPEQAEMSGLDVDTRTDIYSLGVMLYELLVGVLPFDPETLRSASFGEIQRIIREEEPPKASTRLSSLGDTQASIAEHRKADPSSLRREIKGDLDWITMRAMAKDRTQRYASASELEADIERYIRHEPVVAGPPSTIYRIKKYIKRHKVGVAAAAFVILAIVIGIAGTSIGLVKAMRAEKKAKIEAETARQVSDFLVNLFKVSDPSEAKGNTITVREILDKGSQEIKTGLQEQPTTQARLMDTMGKVYLNLGLNKKSSPLLEEALKLRQNIHGENSSEVARSLDSLSLLLCDEAKYEKAESMSQRALQICEEQLGPKHPMTAEILNNLGEIYRKMGRYEDAKSSYTRSLNIREEVLGPEHPDVASCLNHMGIIAHDQGNYKEAESLYTRALTIWEKSLGKEHPKVTPPLNNLGLLYYRLGKLEESESLLQRCLAINEKIYGSEHPNVAMNLHNLALIYGSQEKFTESESLYRRAINIDEKVHGPDHPDVAIGLDNLAILYCRQSKFQEALPIFKRALAIREKALGPDHPDVAYSLNNLGCVHADMGKHAKAEPIFKRALAIREKALGPDHYLVASCLNNLGEAYLNLQKFEEAAPLIQRSLSIIEKAFGQEHRTYALYLHTLGNLYREWKKYDKAKSIYQRALSIKEKILPPNHSQIADILEDYAVLLRRDGQIEEAEKLEARAHTIRNK